MSEEKDAQEEKEPKAKYFREQFDDEEVKLVFKKHPIVMRKGIVLAAVGLLAGMIPALIKPEYSWFFGGLALGLVLALILLFPWWVKWYFSVYIMTDQRFIQQSRSLLQINFVDIGLEQIQMINYQIAGLEETMLHFGTITIQTYVGDLVIRDVHHPEKVQKKMVHILREMGIHPSQRPYQEDVAKAVES
ncbi:MAG TPA: PH domain-containing protein [Candidatus Saccharimonadales bacterium]